jgi:shikimate dehydrogenase
MALEQQVRSYYSLGLTGYPLGHSLSPRLHQAALKSLGLQGEYCLYPIPPGDEQRSALGDLLEQVRRGELLGLNVTIPHKQTVIPFLDQLTPTAQAIGAVNTIYLANNRLTGDNTDAPGFMNDLRQQLSRSVEQREPDKRCALILGAGGSARAILYALLQAGYSVTIAARRLDQAKNLASTILDPGQNVASVSILQLEAAAIARWLTFHKGLDLLVNTTPLGMSPDVETNPWPAELEFPAGVFVYDLVYNPAETALVRVARSSGLHAVTGLGMLIEQALLAFERWTGLRPDRQAMPSFEN